MNADRAGAQPVDGRDARGNVVGDITHPDGTVESVDALSAWADAFETADTTRSLAPPTNPMTTADPARDAGRVRHATICAGVAAEEAAAGAGLTAPEQDCPRCGGRGRIGIHAPPPTPTAQPRTCTAWSCTGSGVRTPAVTTTFRQEG